MSGAHPIEVLFIEDSAGDALLMGQILAKFPTPVKLTVARDGVQALVMLADPAFQPDLIILDLNIPLISGHVVLERNLRKDIPVVMFSASWNEADVERARALGAHEYVQKPMTMQAYTHAVREMVEKWALHKGDAANGAASS